MSTDSSPAPFAIHAGLIVDPVLGAVEDRIIEIAEGRILAVTDAANWTNPGIEVHDLSDRVVLPGFIDCHEHLTISGGDEAEQAGRPITRQAVTAATTARAMLDAGITTVRTLGDNHDLDIVTRRAIEEGIIPGPRIIPAVAPIARTGGHAHFIASIVDGETAARSAVRDLLRRGAKWIKIMASGGNSTPGSDPLVQELTDAELLAIADEAHRAGLDVTGHLHGGDAVDTAIAAGFRSIEHGAFLTDEQLEKIADAGVWLVSTVGIGRAVAEDPSAPEFYRAKARTALARRIDVLRTARAAGVRVAVGCDGNHGKIRTEAESLLDAGFTPWETLTSLTLEGARLCRIDTIAGSVAAGKDADLVVLDADPIADVSAYGQVHRTYRAGALHAVSLNT